MKKKTLKIECEGVVCVCARRATREGWEKIGKFHYYTSSLYFFIIIIIVGVTSSHLISFRLPHLNHIYNKICGFNLSGRNCTRKCCQPGIDISRILYWCIVFCMRIAAFAYGIFPFLLNLISQSFCIPQRLLCAANMRECLSRTYHILLYWDWCLVYNSRKCESKIISVCVCVVHSRSTRKRIISEVESHRTWCSLHGTAVIVAEE